MSWKDWLCVLIAVLGIVLFLYGANYYDNVVGWLGVFFFFASIVALIVLYVYNALKPKSPISQNM